MFFVDNPFITKKKKSQCTAGKHFKYDDAKSLMKAKDEKLFKFGKDLMDNFSKILIDNRQDELL